MIERIAPGCSHKDLAKTNYYEMIQNLVPLMEWIRILRVVKTVVGYPRPHTSDTHPQSDRPPPASLYDVILNKLPMSSTCNL